MALSCDVVGCRDCGLVQAVPLRPGRGKVHCRRCDRVLERTNGRSLEGALACALATLLLLIPGNVLPLMQVNILQAVNRSLVFSGILGMWRQDWHVVAIILAAELVFLPFIRFGSLAAVLLMLKLGRHAAWLGPTFRWSQRLDQWAMVDVYLIGGVIGYARIAPYFPVHLQAGAYCLITAGFMTMVTRATIERREVWRRIGPVVERAEPGMIACTGCDLPTPHDSAGQRCPRCGERLTVTRPIATMRAIALTIAAFIFYPPAYLYPMQYSVELGRFHGYTIFTGVHDLLQANLYFFATLIFCFSVLVPLLKLFALAWCGMSIHRRSARRLRMKTKLYRAVDEIGRWSHIDPFTVAVFLPLMVLHGFLSVAVGYALPAFLAVVVLTMLASAEFDPRALWRAGGVR